MKQKNLLKCRENKGFRFLKIISIERCVDYDTRCIDINLIYDWICIRLVFAV
jgi:hypothetical protein